MDRHAHTTTGASPEQLFEIVGDLGRYPEWLDAVSEVESADGDSDDLGPAWFVTITARVGPFRRSKRLRMVRTLHDAPARVRFERRELDGRQHAPWTLDGLVGPHDDGSEVTVDLHYDGGLWDPVLEVVLGQMIDDAIPNLRRLVA